MALDGISLRLEAGATLAVLGANGAGKSTLLRVLATLLRPHRGTVRVLGSSLPAEAVNVRGRIGYIGHEPLLYRDLTGRENLRFHARLHGVGHERVEDLLEAVGMAGRAGQRVAELSRGMSQRLAVARALIADPPLLLLDEPRANLDPAAADLLEPLIGRAAGRTRVIVTHDIEAGLAESDLVLGLRAGRQVLCEPAGPADAPRLARALFVKPRAEMGRQMTRAALAILRKDLRVELRAREAVPAMALFAITAFVLFHFAFDRDVLDGDVAAGTLWVTLLLATVLGVNRLFVAEREQGGLEAMLLAPIDRTAIFLAKAAALFLYLVAVEVVAVPAFAVLLLGPDLLGSLPALTALLLLADLGLAAVGALVGALAAETRAREVIGPLLLLPLVVPLAIAGAQATEPLFTGAGTPEDLGRWLGLMGLYATIFVLLSVALFDFLLED